MNTPAEELLRDGTLDIRRAAEFSGLSRSKLYQDMEAGRLPFLKVGRRRLIPKRGLLTYLARSLRGGEAHGAVP